MTIISHWKQANSDYAVVQPGSAGAGKAALVLGAKSGRPHLFEWDDLVSTFMNSGNPEYVGYFDDFLGDGVSGVWDSTVSDGGSIDMNSQPGGVVRLTLDATDDDFANLALGTHWTVSKGWTFFEARVKSVTAITLRAIEVGLSDATTESDGLAFSDHSVGGVTDVATDAVLFGYDTDASMTAWAANAVNSGTPQAVDIGIAPSTSWQRLGIAVDALGNAYFYLDGVLVAEIEGAVATTAVLTPFIALKSLSAAAKSIDVDYVLVAGTR